MDNKKNLVLDDVAKETEPIQNIQGLIHWFKLIFL